MQNFSPNADPANSNSSGIPAPFVSEIWFDRC
jgi:hypothetical protein